MKQRHELYDGNGSVTVTFTEFTAEQTATMLRDRARSLILERYPDWKQANMTARGVALHSIARERAWSAAEAEEMAALDIAWDWIRAVRDRSNALQAADEGGLAIDIYAGAVEGQGNWPS